MESPGVILNSLDNNDVNFIDTLIANEQKIVISQYVVQTYLQEIWQGQVALESWQLLLFFAGVVLFPPMWFFFSVPVERGLNKACLPMICLFQETSIVPTVRVPCFTVGSFGEVYVLLGIPFILHGVPCLGIGVST